MQSKQSDSERAVIGTWLIEDAFIGNNLTNGLISADSELVGSSLLVDHLGNVGIGTNSPDSKLTVKGNIHAEEVKVDLSVPGPDYVFKEDYDLKSLEEVQNYIKEHGHLPNIPSAKEMETNGIQLGEMNMKLLEKIEELTLYILEQEKRIKKLEQK
ncbi:tail fiber protein [Flagellimonas taeanensis]|nr:tail fiber protein [Allomuricauda taeanensis]